MYARPRFQGGTQSQYRCPPQGMGGKVPQLFFRIRWIKACLAFTHTQIFCQVWNACGFCALRSKKNYLLTIFQKPLAFYFSEFNDKAQYWKTERQGYPLTLGELQWHEETTNMINMTTAKERGFCEWKMSY